MKTIAMKWISALCAVVALVGCQEQRMIQQFKENHIRRHTEQCLREYQYHERKLQCAAPDLKKNVQRAVRAQWEWIVDCDVSNADLIPKPVKLGQSEFKELVELMGKMQSMPALPKSYFMTEPPPFRMPDDLQPPVLVEPFAGCCGGVSLSLMFYNAGGVSVECWDHSQVIPASRVSEWSNSNKGRPVLMMPDEAYQRLINLPSSLKAEKLDKEFRKKSQHNH